MHSIKHYVILKADMFGMSSDALRVEQNRPAESDSRNSALGYTRKLLLCSRRDKVVCAAVAICKCRKTRNK